MAKKPEREIERWVTWHGRRIPIYKGESKAEVAERMKASFKQGAEKGKEGRPVTKEGEENLRRKASDAERKAMHAIEDEKANPTERRKRLADKANKKADEAWSKYNKVWNKKEDGKRINKIKFNRPSQKAESKQDQKWVSDFKKDFAKTRAQAEKMFHENDSEDIKDILFESGLGDHMDIDSMSTSELREKVLSLYDKKSTPSSADNTAYAYGNGHITRVPAGVKPLAHGGETYNFIAHVKGQLKPNYFKTEKEAQAFLDNVGKKNEAIDSSESQSKVDRWGRKDWYDDERRRDIKKFRDQNPVTEYKDLSKLPSKIADDEVLLIKQTNKEGELEYYHGRWAGKDRQSGWAVDQVTDYGYKDPKKVREAIESHNREGSDHPYTAILVKKFPSHKDNEAYKVGDSQKISSGALSKTASRLQNKGITGQEAIENHLKGLSSTRRNRLAKELGVEGRGADKIKAMASKISEQQGGKGQQKVDKEDINNAKSRLETYKYQLKDVQDEIADAESIRPSLRHPDYDKNVASLKQKEANLKKWIKDDEELTAKEKQIANAKANARIREAEQQIRDIENGKSGNKQYWENEKKQAEKDLLASQTANAENQKAERNNPYAEPQFKTREEAEEYYVDYYSKMKPAQRNKIAKGMRIGGKGADRVLAMAMVASSSLGLPFEKHDDEDFHTSWNRTAERNKRLKDLATRNLDERKIPKSSSTPETPSKSLDKVKPGRFSAQEAQDKINKISLARNNGNRKDNDYKQIQDTLSQAPTGTIMIKKGERGSVSKYKKLADGTWEYMEGPFKGDTRDNKTLSMDWAWYDSSPQIEFTTEKKMASQAAKAKSLTEKKMTKAANLPGVKSHKSALTRSGNTMYLDLDDSDMTTANIKALEKKGWKRRGLGNGTWYFR